MVKTVLSLFLVMLVAGSLASCMDDPITSEEAIAQNIFRPNSIGFRFLDYVPNAPTGSIKVYWSNSSSDAQKNFGGYVARILTFDSVLVPGTSTYIQRATTFAQKIVDKTTLEVIFDAVPVNKEYVFAVWGMRNPDPLKPDSLILSRDSVASFTVPVVNKRTTFDPRPLQNPTVIRAASIGPTTVRLEWDLPSTHGQGNLLSYTVYYKDPNRLGDSAKIAGSRPYIALSDTNSSTAGVLTVTVPGASVGAGISVVKEYEFWVKSVRIDSMQFYDDSVKIKWSGAESLSVGDSLGNNGIHLGQGLFYGNLQGRFSAKEVSPDDPTADLKIEDAGENIVITGIGGTRFYASYHGSSTLDVAKFSAPLRSEDYDQDQLTLPKATPQGGWIIYAKMFGDKNEVARLLLRGSGSSVIGANNTISVSLTYQPQTTSADPLPYF